MDLIRWEIAYDDRVGLISDLTKVLSHWNINIKSFELHEKYLYVELEGLPKELKVKLDIELKKIKGIENIRIIELLPWEQREKQLQAVLDSIGEGIIAVDNKGVITNINPVAKKILSLAQEEVIGRLIKEVLGGKLPILKCLQTGKPYFNREMVFNTPKARLHYLTSGRPLTDRNGKVIGAVASLKDMNEVHKLVYDVTKPYMTTFNDIIGQSPALKQAINLAKLVAKGAATVLIRGESGTGKEIFARAIHMESVRRNQPFVPINCAALPDALLESELFGYVEGSFTGAQKGGKAGLFEFANKGTIFLDEIGEISPHIQAKLLRALQEGKVRRIGDTEENSVDVRVIAATNRNLEEMIKKGDFREDLYYRLNVVPLYMPALRERKEDIKLLTDFFIQKIGQRQGKNITDISRKALDKLYKHDWPGNVRELENVLERAIILADQDAVDEEHILLDYQDKLSWPAQEKLSSNLKEAVDEFEKDIIIQELKAHGTVRQTAKKLGVSHTTILNKLKKYHIDW